MDLVGSISVLEDNLEYDVVDTLDYKGNKYILFSGVLNSQNIKIRKIITKNNKQYFDLLSESEFNNVILKFIEKNKELI